MINLCSLVVHYFSSVRGGAGVVVGGSEKVASLEQKLFKLQEELTELHRQKGEVCLILISPKQCLTRGLKELTRLLIYEVLFFSTGNMAFQWKHLPEGKRLIIIRKKGKGFNCLTFQLHGWKVH